MELPKVPEKDLKSLKDLWMRFFTADDEETLEMLKNRDPIFRRAVDKLVYFSADEQLRYDLDMREKWELDHGSIMAANVKKGRQEGKEEIARRMIKENMDISLIAKMTELPVERVKEIISGL